MPKCPNCGNDTATGAVFCDQCGARLSPPEPSVSEAVPAPASGSIVCPACGAGNVPGEAFCDFCGSPLDAPVPEVTAATEPAPEATQVEVAVEDVLPVEDRLACPACGAEVQAGEAFCANCGASLVVPAAAPEQPSDVVEEEPPSVEVPAAPGEQGAEIDEVLEAQVLPPAVGMEGMESEAEEEEVAVEVAPPPAAPIPPAEPVCPACGTAVAAGDKFCSNCGAVLEPVAEAVPAEAGLPPAPAASIGPRLVVAASGAEIPLAGFTEVLIGRQDPVSGIFPDVDLTPHEGEEGGVSRKHARLTLEGASLFIEDLDSTNFTFVNKQKLAPGTRHPLNDGDEIRCGRVALILKT